ncbi:hypothetical protein T492DRAFT_1036275 [Pavlovales sp. CCMP2436]|nr:hypothetical protein T492DRAFT_1036275 [Pavlovales sp. CCMP2436]
MNRAPEAESRYFCRLLHSRRQPNPQASCRVPSRESMHDGTRPFPCDFPDSKRPFPCDFPGFGYRAFKPSGLVIHTRAHSGERPFPCDFPGCGYRATQPGHLKTHKRTHSDERPFPCDAPGC